MEGSGTTIIFQRGWFVIDDQLIPYVKNPWGEGFWRITDLTVMRSLSGRLQLVQEGSLREKVGGHYRCGNLSVGLDNEGHISAVLDNRRILLADFA